MSEFYIKNAAITRTGFDYQDLIGIEILIEFYRDPERYKWVQLESEDGEFGALDDVVAALPDGTFELTQVKFTPRPDTHRLSWEWLLEKAPRGTSRLQKWATSLQALTLNGKVKSACLKANRRPDCELAKALVNGLLDLEAVETSLRTTIENELGGAAEASHFFSSFEFKHSEPMIDRLGTKLRGRLVPSSTNSEGWLLLLHQARRWASVRNEPQPNGRITHKHLAQIITRKRPQPLSQDFRIPYGYQPPSRSFHDDLMKRVTDQPGIWALWGSPGRGKSTYLSYAVDHLHKQEVPTIRHHYFLSLADSGDRNHFADIASSLMDQMVVRYGDAVKGLEEVPTELRKWVEACAAHFTAKGKPFVVVIDGLDHVAREYADLSQMNQLFNALLPCPPNVTVWAFEWEQVKTATSAPLSGFPYHFIEASLERSGVSAQIDQRQGDVYRSAFLRTLNSAVDLWNMPIDVAYAAACKCLPLNRGLVDIERVDRPHWLGDLPDACAGETVSLEPIIKEILTKAAATGALIPVHLKTPLSLKISEFSWLTVSCVLLSDDYAPLPDADIADLGGSAWQLPTGSLFSGHPRQLKAESRFRPAAQGKCLPLCVDVFPVPLGYWLSDLFHVGLSLPASYAFPRPISYRCADGGIVTEASRQAVGRWMTWNDH